MKKFLIIIAVIFLYTSTQAQFVRGYGIKIGATMSSHDWDYSSRIPGIDFNSDNRLGLNIGVYAELLNVPYISIVTELNYIQKGMEIDVPVTTSNNPDAIGNVTWDTRLDYINLTALGKFRLNYLLLSPYIIAGPKVDFEINKSFSELSARDVEDEYEKSRVGFKVGIGTEVKLLTFNLLAEVVYDADFNELFENENLKINTNSFDIRVGLLF